MNGKRKKNIATDNVCVYQVNVKEQTLYRALTLSRQLSFSVG